mmetsp:Transcript_31897/g.54943  ORF Transcript_31897/g.54943 Transcript_31897/m.54943 type:complete len:677 (-) Transcript_31897:153-2183(-)
MLWLFICSAYAAWQTVEISTDPPDRRAGHSVITYGDTLVMFGGCYLDTTCYKDLYIFKPSAKSWVKKETYGDSPAAREGHSATLVGSKMYVIGGSSTEKLYDDAYALDLETFKWARVEAEGTNLGRAYHAAALGGSGLILVFGGYTKDGLSDELITLDIQKLHWGHPSVIGAQPSARKYHSFAKIHSKYWVFGGQTGSGAANDLYYLDFDAMKWHESAAEDRPVVRAGHGTVVSGSLMYISAGCDSEAHYCYSDMYSWDGDQLVWAKVDEGSGFKARERHSMGMVSGVLYVFGGSYFMSEAYQDTLSYDTGNKCPSDCSDNGTCTDSGCDCNDGYKGDDCGEKTQCKDDCNDHGSCASDYLCDCYPGYTGSYCQGYIDCPNNCTSSDRGTCEDSGSCTCQSGYKGDDCSEAEAWKTCEENCEHGSCDSSGACTCTEKWVGTYCNVEKPKTYSQSSSTSSSSDSSSSEEQASTISSTNKTYSESSSVPSTSYKSRKYSQSKSMDSADYEEADYASTDDYMAGQDEAAVSYSEDYDNSTHLLTPEMFGFSSIGDPNDYTQQNLRNNSDLATTDDRPRWLKEVVDSQDTAQDDLAECLNYCNFHGICDDKTCYCEDDYTGANCEILEDDLKKGVDLTTGLAVIFVCYLIGFVYGQYKLYHIKKKVYDSEESKFLGEMEL